MSDNTRTFRNFLSLTGAQGLTMVTGLVTAMILTRALQPENFGVLGFGTAILSYLGLLVVLGTDTIGARDVAREPDSHAIVQDILGMRLATAALVMALFVPAVHFLPQAEEVKTVLVIQAFGLFVSAVMLDFYFQGVQRMGVIALRQAVAALASVFAVIALVRSPGDLFVAAAIPVVATALGAALLVAVFLRETRALPVGLRPGAWLGVARRALPLAFAALMVTVYYNIDIVMLGFMVGRTELGWHTASARVLALGLVCGEMLRAAFLPRLARLRDAPDGDPATLRAFFVAVLLLGLAVAAVGMVESRSIIRILFGADYLGGSRALAILMGAVAAYHVVIVYGSPIVAWDKDKTFAVVSAFGAVANVALNLVLIPRFGIEGAAAATLISQSCVALVLAYAFARLSHATFVSLVTRFLIAAALGAAAAWGAGHYLPAPDTVADAVLRLAAATAVFAVVYLGAAAVLKLARPAEALGLLRQVLGRDGGEGSG